MESNRDETKKRDSCERKRKKEDFDGKNGDEGVNKKADSGASKDGSKSLCVGNSSVKNSVEEQDEPLEEFEIGASEHVTKQDAMKQYCLPNGTLAVCEYIEKPNPRNGAWKPMKLYLRAEVRRRARERFGGLEGLVTERKKRETKRYEKDMSKAADFFR